MVLRQFTVVLLIFLLSLFMNKVVALPSDDPELLFPREMPPSMPLPGIKQELVSPIRWQNFTDSEGQRIPIHDPLPGIIDKNCRGAVRCSPVMSIALATSCERAYKRYNDSVIYNERTSLVSLWPTGCTAIWGLFSLLLIPLSRSSTVVSCYNPLDLG